MNYDLQPTLENELVKLVPLKKEDYDSLYLAASDPLIWEQHPDRYRYTKEGFEKYFEDAIKSGGALLIKEKSSNEVMGSSRYYGPDKEKKSIAIGFTFLTRKYWGTTYNRALKELMLDHAFKFVETVIFHVGNKNIRSQKAVEKLGAAKVGEIKRKNSDDNFQTNLIYELDKNTWANIQKESEVKTK